MNFQVGLLENNKEDDPTFDTESECIEWIENQQSYSLLTYGIWTGQNFGSELICIFFGVEVFRK